MRRFQVQAFGGAAPKVQGDWGAATQGAGGPGCAAPWDARNLGACIPSGKSKIPLRPLSSLSSLSLPLFVSLSPFLSLLPVLPPLILELWGTPGRDRQGPTIPHWSSSNKLEPLNAFRAWPSW